MDERRRQKRKEILSPTRSPRTVRLCGRNDENINPNRVYSTTDGRPFMTDNISCSQLTPTNTRSCAQMIWNDAGRVPLDPIQGSPHFNRTTMVPSYSLHSPNSGATNTIRSQLNPFTPIERSLGCEFNTLDSSLASPSTETRQANMQDKNFNGRRLFQGKSNYQSCLIFKKIPHKNSNNYLIRYQR